MASNITAILIIGAIILLALVILMWPEGGQVHTPLTVPKPRPKTQKPVTAGLQSTPSAAATATAEAILSSIPRKTGN